MLFQLHQVSVNHTGEYTCTASNDMGSAVTVASLLVMTGEYT